MNNKNPKPLILLALVVLFSTSNLPRLNAQEMDYFLFGDMVYSEFIGTVLFHSSANQLAAPRILHNSSDKVILRFDDLQADFKNYHYTIIHCDANWEPSRIQKFEYVDGFQQDIVRNYSRSKNTVVPYTQYWLEFPTADMKPRISGNYILKVYLNGNPDDLVLTRRFMVYEQSIAIDGTARQSMLPRFSDTHQRVSFSLNLGRYQISNPERDIKVVVTQNGRWDNAKRNLKPRMVLGNELVFDHEYELLFEGGNVFRRFDTRSLRSGSEFVEDIIYDSRLWEVILRKDVNRSTQGFVLADHINGKFLVSNYDFANEHLEGEYAYVYFSLPAAEPFFKASVHIIGALTDWAPSEYNRLTYNHREKKYQTGLLLKQGYYNYQYAVLAEGSTQATVEPIEGNHSVARNEYNIFIYHRKPGEYYDRLVGLRQLTTP